MCVGHSGHRVIAQHIPAARGSCNGGREREGGENENQVSQKERKHRLARRGGASRIAEIAHHIRTYNKDRFHTLPWVKITLVSDLEEQSWPCF